MCRSTQVKRVKADACSVQAWHMLRMLWGKPWVVITPENVLGDTCDNKSLKETLVSVMSLPPEE